MLLSGKVRKTLILELTPTFKWKANAGVPYYHVILSDEAIKYSNEDNKVRSARIKYYMASNYT